MESPSPVPRLCGEWVSLEGVEAAAANVHGVTVAAGLLREDDEVVYGDSAYLGIEKREEEPEPL